MIKLEINKADFDRIVSAKKKVMSKIYYWGKDDGGMLNRRCSIEYSQVVLQNIMKMTVPEPKYSDKYADWKAKYGKKGYPSPWRLFGDLIENLSSFRSGKGWAGGIPLLATDQGGKSWFGKGDKGKPQNISMYGIIHEFGKKKRPVFVPSMWQYASDGWIVNINKTMKSILDQWK